MIYTWNEILPSAIDSLLPMQKEIVRYIMGLSGKRKLSYGHARKTWGLDREQFDTELDVAFTAICLYFHQHGVTGSADLDFG